MQAVKVLLCKWPQTTLFSEVQRFLTSVGWRGRSELTAPKQSWSWLMVVLVASALALRTDLAQQRELDPTGSGWGGVPWKPLQEKMIL